MPAMPMEAAPAFTRPSAAPPAHAAPGRLSRAQFGRLALFAVGFWYVAAVFIRFGLPAGLYGGGPGALLFAATVPLAWGSVWLAARVAGLRPAQVVPGTAFACAVAMLCDGVALTWAPGVYGGASAGLALGAAWLLFGVGAILVAALLTASRRGA
jgi:hypothetical protein